MVDVEYKNNVLVVKGEDVAVNLECTNYRRIDGVTNMSIAHRLGCENIYNARVRYIIVGISKNNSLTNELNTLISDKEVTIISTDTNRERILRDEKLQSLLSTGIKEVYKIVYDKTTKIGKNECEQLECYC